MYLCRSFISGYHTCLIEQVHTEVTCFFHPHLPPPQPPDAVQSSSDVTSDRFTSIAQNASASVGCIPTKSSKSSFLAPNFKANPQPRENILNQVATSRVISDPADIQKASKLGDITQSGQESPALSMIPSRLEIQGQIYNKDQNTKNQPQNL